MGVVDLSRKKTHELKLKKIFESTLELIDRYKPDELSIEAPLDISGFFPISYLRSFDSPFFRALIS